MKKLLVLSLILILTGCAGDMLTDEKGQNTDPTSKSDASAPINPRETAINPGGMTIAERFTAPEGFIRVEADSDSFANYLRSLGLKPHGSKVLYFDGAEKNKSNVYDAVVDMEIGSRDLQQCADAIIRLRAEYLYQKEAYDQIHFNFTNGFRVDYKKWTEGYRIAIDGNNTSWVKKTNPSNTYKDFRKYLDIIFAYAGTISLEKELKSVALEDMQIGDVFIQGGSPGHAVIVVDMIQNKETGEKRFLLAQSYMPAQEIQVLQNPMDSNISPWYSLGFGDTLKTPEWSFKSSDLKGFQ